MYDDGKELPYYRIFLDNCVEVSWPHLRPLAKLLCRTASLSANEPSNALTKGIKSTISFNLNSSEVTLHVLATISGSIISCFTGGIALVIIGTKTFWVFRKATRSVTMAVATQLISETPRVCLRLFMRLVIRPWIKLAVRIVIFLWWITSSPVDTPQVEESPPLPPHLVANEPGESGPPQRGVVYHYDAITTDFEGLGGWLIPGSPGVPETNLSSPHERRHRRTGTGSSARLSNASSPDLVRIPLQMHSSSRDASRRRRNRSGGSGTSSPESTFRMTARTDTNPVAHYRKHSRSGSSSTAATQ